MRTQTLAIKLKLGRHSAGMLLTPKEFDAITEYDDRYCYELINGVVVVSPLPSEAEGDPNEELGFFLRSYQYQHPQGSNQNLTLQERYVLTENRRRADRLIWAGLGRLPDPEVDLATIAVEFVSRGKRNQLRDYLEKRREYLAAGVKEFWLMDRFRRIMTVYRKKPGKAGEQVIREGEIYRPTLLPGFELDLARLLAVADRWSQARQRKKKRRG
jgi:Uma2 family endonuclease